MKIIKFIFEFVDHERKTCLHLCVEVLSDKVLEWEHHEDDLERIIAWKTKHIIWEHKLKHEVKKMIAEKFFKGDHKFSDFTLVKYCMNHDADLFNMNVEKNTKDIKFRVTKKMEKHFMKFKCGTAPRNWVEVFDYEKINQTFIFQCVHMEDQHDHQIKLVEKAVFNIPHEKKSYHDRSLDTEYGQSNNFYKTNMYGGEYDREEKRREKQRREEKRREFRQTVNSGYGSHNGY